MEDNFILIGVVMIIFVLAFLVFAPKNQENETTENNLVPTGRIISPLYNEPARPEREQILVRTTAAGFPTRNGMVVVAQHDIYNRDGYGLVRPCGSLLEVGEITIQRPTSISPSTTTRPLALPHAAWKSKKPNNPRRRKRKK
uniref:uncharacterized protein LOC120339258 n=1 Tax=Styela clava TaxID=7725 RepID=UPI00193A44A5|nr:uncharacterized protein LOC120339258 [Styela clava]